MVTIQFADVLVLGATKCNAQPRATLALMVDIGLHQQAHTTKCGVYLQVQSQRTVAKNTKERMSAVIYSLPSQFHKQFHP